jgi:hypothetical protein
MLYQIANADIRFYPWTHVIFDTIFCDVHYEQIISMLPEESSLTNIKEITHHGDYYSNNRYVLNDFSLLDENKNKFFNELREMFLDGKLKSLLLNKFNSLIVNRIGEKNINNVEFYDTFQLTFDKKSYYLAPHPDIFNKVLTIIINLPKDNSNENMGTVMYGSKNWSDIIYKSKYRTNSGFAVFRSDDSWHGVEETISDRWSIQYTIWGKDK